MTELDKHAMVRDLGIRYRDALMLDPAIPIPFPASLLVREKAIIVNLEAIRMIICANQCYVLSVPKDGDAAAAVLPTVDNRFVRHLSACLATMHPATGAATVHVVRSTHGEMFHSSGTSGGGLTGHDFDPDAPYELRALEVGLAAVVREMDSEAWALERDGYPASDTMAKAVSASSLEAVRSVKERLGRIAGRAERMKTELEKLLSDDGDMADMYLGRRANESGAALPPQPRSLSNSGACSQQSLAEEPEGSQGGGAAEPSTSAAEGAPVGSAPAGVGPPEAIAASAVQALAIAPGGSTLVRGGSLGGIERIFGRVSGRVNGSIVIRRLRSFPRCHLTISSSQTLQPSSSSIRGMDTGSTHGEAAPTAASLQPLSPQAADEQQQQRVDLEPEEGVQEEELIITNPLGGAFVDPRDIESAEDLLETAFIHVDYIIRRLQLLSDRITDDEMLVRIAMDGRRNELVLLNLLVTNVTMGFAYVSMVTGFFGQNLYQVIWLAESRQGFWSILAVCFAGLCALPAAVLFYMRRRNLTFVSGMT